MNYSRYSLLQVFVRLWSSFLNKAKKIKKESTKLTKKMHVNVNRCHFDTRWKRISICASTRAHCSVRVLTVGWDVDEQLTNLRMVNSNIDLTFMW